MSSLKVYVCTDFSGHWPVGTSAIVVATGPDRAKAMLNYDLELMGLKSDAEHMQKLDITVEAVHILQDGEY